MKTLIEYLAGILPISFFIKELVITPLMQVLRKECSKLHNQVKINGLTNPAREIYKSINHYSSALINQSLGEIPEIGYIEKEESGLIRNEWEKGINGILLSGEGGAGKSTIALKIAQDSYKQGVPVVYINTADLPDEPDPQSVLEKGFGFKDGFLESLRILGKEKHLILIFDQLDKTIPHDNLYRNLLKLIKESLVMEKALVLVVCRSQEVKDHQGDIESLRLKEIKCKKLTISKASGYLEKLNITNPLPELLELSCNLLNLSIIAQITKKSKPSLDKITSLTTLWLAFVNSIKKHEGESQLENACKFARELQSAGYQSSPLSITRKSSLYRLISRGVIVEQPGRRLSFRHNNLQTFFCAYDLLPERLTPENLKAEFGRFLSIDLIRNLHGLYHLECPEEENKFIIEFLKAKVTLNFFQRVAILDNLKEYDEVPQDLAVKLTEIISNDKEYENYFFNDLENLSWVKPLQNVEYFYHPPCLTITEDSGYLAPFWPAGNYLIKAASSHPDIIVDIVKHIKTDNHRVCEALVRAIMNCPPEYAAQCTGTVLNWLSDVSSTFLILDIMELSKYFMNHDYTKEVLAIHKAVLVSKRTEDFSKENRFNLNDPIKFAYDPYWINEIINKSLPYLIDKDVFATIEGYEEKLSDAIFLTEQIVGNETDWFDGIPYRRGTWYPDPDSERLQLLDLLINGLLESLNEACKAQPTKCKDKLISYLESDNSIWLLIGLNILRLHGDKFPEILQKVFSTTRFLNIASVQEELLNLMGAKFNLLSLKNQTKYLGMIMEGPFDLEERIKNRARRRNQEPGEDDRKIIQEEWHQWYLARVKKWLFPPYDDYYQYLETTYGLYEPYERRRGFVASWSGDYSPLTEDEIKAMPVDEFVDYLIAFKPTPEEDIKGVSINELANTFKTVVQKESEKCSKYAHFLGRKEIPPLYLGYFFSGITESIKTDVFQVNESIINLCEVLVTRERKTDHSEKDNNNLKGVYLQITRMLEKQAFQDQPYLEQNLLDQILNILIRLADHPDPKQEDEAKIQGFNPSMYSMDCVRGMSMRALLEFALYQNRKYKYEQKLAEFPPSLPHKIQRVLENKLDKESDPSLSVHSVFGIFFPKLLFMDDEWVKENLDNIFPTENEKSNFWQAAWDGYIGFNNVFRQPFMVLIPQYRRAVENLKFASKGNSLITPEDRLSQHIMVLYLHGIIDFDSEDGLFIQFFEQAPDELRASAIGWLGSALEEIKPGVKDEKWSRLWKLWKWRAEVINKSDQKNMFQQELSSFIRWVKHIPVGLDDSYSLIHEIVLFCSPNYPIQFIIEYLAKNCKEFPLQAIDLMLLIESSGKSHWRLQKDEDLEMILSTVKDSNNPEAKKKAEQFINICGEKGDYRWREYLPDN